MANTRARQLRRDSTDAERHVWSRLRDRQLHGLKFRRQYRIGHFITNFYCDECRLVVELDGGQHAEISEADERRTQFLESEAIMVLRFWNNEVMANTEGVLERIAEIAMTRRRSEEPSPGRTR